MSYIGKKPVDFNDVTEAQTFTVTGDLTVDTDTLFVDSTNNAVGVGTASPNTYGKFVAFSSGGHFSVDTNGQVNSTQSIDVATAGGRFTGSSSRGALGSIHIEQTTTGADGGYMAFRTSPSGSTTPSERMRIDSSGNVDLYQGNNLTWRYAAGSTIRGSMSIDSADNITFSNGSSNTERMRIDGSGNLLVGKTSSDFGVTAGFEFYNTNIQYLTRDGGASLILNRLSSDGDIALFRKDGTTVGQINSRSGLVLSVILDPRDPGVGITGTTRSIQPTDYTGAPSDNLVDLGDGSTRYDDIFATNSTIQTSDQNEKQQIASLTDAEITAAKAISKLFKTYKWNDKVEAKGDNARIHAGVIAQNVQSAMTDAGLDATKYAFFCSDTWWETNTEVPAVEAVEARDAVYDDDGNLVSEAVEAVEAVKAHTWREVFKTADEAPEGATERTRLGIRYPELLAFIGAATEQRLTHLETLEARIEALENA